MTIDIEKLKEKVIFDFEEEREGEIGHVYKLGLYHTIDYLHSRGYLGGVPEWQPIETYDYDGLPQVLLAGFITPSEYAQSNGSKPGWEISIGRCWHVNTRKFTGFFFLGQQPTHWMPLPAAPKGETK